VKRVQNIELDTETTIPERFISGAIAGFISQTAVYPLDVCIFHSSFRNLLFYF
jgi:hypothetical protein